MVALVVGAMGELSCLSCMHCLVYLHKKSLEVLNASSLS